MGGERTFAASAKSKGKRVESGRSGHQPFFSVVQTQLMAAVSSNQQVTRCAGMAAFQSLRLDGYQMIVPLHIYLTRKIAVTACHGLQLASPSRDYERIFK